MVLLLISGHVLPLLRSRVDWLPSTQAWRQEADDLLAAAAKAHADEARKAVERASVYDKDAADIEETHLAPDSLLAQYMLRVVKENGAENSVVTAAVAAFLRS